MKFDVLTIFPELFEPFITTSLVGKASEAGRLEFGVHNIRDFAEDKHKTVDDTPYGGGAGMVMKIEPIDKALQALKTQTAARTVVLSARGEQFTQDKAQEYAQLDQLVLICGRYEGIDQRVADYLADEEISIGPYVLNGGEVAAMTVIEAVTRLVPGVLGNEESLREESYGASLTEKEYPQYTKPAEFRGWKVPDVLLGGNHAAIKKWRKLKKWYS